MSDQLFVMPSLGADMTEGTVLSWYVKPGDRVHRGDLVALIDTEKAEIEAEIWQDATIAELLVDVGRTVPVGEPLARLATSNGAAPVSAQPLREAVAAPHPLPTVAIVEPPARGMAPPHGLQTAPVSHHLPPTYSPLVRQEAQRMRLDIDHITGTGPGGAVTRHDLERATAGGPGQGSQLRSSPLARRLAADAGIDLLSLGGTGPGGAVVAADVAAAVSSSPAGAPTPAAGGRVAQAAVETPAAPTAETPAAPTEDTGLRGSAKARLASNRQAVAELMSRSKREIPHYYLTLDIDCGMALSWLEQANSSRPITSRLLPAVLLLRATALAAAEVPDLNGHWVNGFRPSEEVALGVAVSLRGGGLLAPVLHRADEGTLDELMSQLNGLVTRARRGALRAADMADPSITVTNLGDQGGDSVYPVIYPPQVAMVGFGRIRERPWAEGGMLGVRPVVTATLAGDHRASDGHIGSRFLAVIARRLADPASL